MCWFITLGIKPVAFAELEKLGHNRSGLALSLASNRHVAELFPKDDVLYYITTGMCSCGLMPQARIDDSRQLEHRRERYRKQGWSEAKIARAIDSTEVVHQSRRRHFHELAPQRGFRDGIAAQVRQFGGLRLFSHFYSGDVDDERVTCNEHRQMTLDEFLAEGVAGDVLLEIKPSVG